MEGAMVGPERQFSDSNARPVGLETVEMMVLIEAVKEVKPVAYPCAANPGDGQPF